MNLQSLRANPELPVVTVALAIFCSALSGCASDALPTERLGIKITEIHEEFIPERTFAISCQVKNTTAVSRRVLLGMTIKYLYTGKPEEHATKYLKIDIEPGKTKLVSAELTVPAEWVGPWKTYWATRRPNIEILSADPVPPKSIHLEKI